MKIINVLKDDTFEEILELFRKAPEGEVFLVLPKNGRLFRAEDHFAAFASEAEQAHKTVSLLTSNPDTSALAKKFGFTVVASQKPGKAKTSAKGAKATLASVPPPADPDIRDEQDDAFADDVPMTSDATMSNESTEDVDPLRNMHVVDDEGNPVEEQSVEDDATPADTQSDFVSAPTTDIEATLAASVVDGVRGGIVQRTLTPKASTERSAPVPVQSGVRELDYIDAVWRDKVGKAKQADAGFVPKLPSLFSRVFGRAAHGLSGSAFPKKVAGSILFGAVVVLAMVVYSIAGSAHVTLSPVGTPLDTQLTVQASDTYTSVDDTFLKLPGQLLEVSKTESKTVNATGERDVASKARGKITVTNEYSSAPQSLVVTTRFQSENGLVFRTLQNITVPGSRVVEGKTIAGTATVDVIADKPGTDYNIPAGKFTIMAFVEKGDTEKAKQFYGVSGQAMSGGASGPSTVVTQGNYDDAQTAAVAAVKVAIGEALAAQGPSLMVLNGDNPAMGESQSSARVDDAASAVTVTATGTLKTVAFRGSDLHELIRRSILKKDRLVVLPEQLTLSYGDISFNADLGSITFTVTIKGTGYAPVDINAIKDDIGGKNTEEIREYFKAKEGVRSAMVTMSPFWVRTVPEKADKITVDVIYDEPSQEAR